MSLIYRGLSKALAAYLNQSVLPEGFGRIRGLNVDPAREEAEAELDLVGETEPVRVQVGYRLTHGEDPPRVELRTFRCSRPWLEALATAYLTGRSWPLPPKVVRVAGPLLGL